MSLFVGCDREQGLDEVLAELSDGGTILLPLRAYPFSSKFGWLADRFRVSWQPDLATGDVAG
jgi:predicted 3-demethylubiquinone-9 3-methyltransferase (glyoxalase superfamily)